MVKLAIMGKAGCGKGTYAQMLAQEFKIKKISTGDLLREEIKKGTDLGKKIASIIDNGNLAPDELVVKLAYENQEEDSVMDGFPRSIEQVKLYENLGESLDKVIYLKCSDEVIKERLFNRINCKNCNQVYNIKTNPPKKQGICDICGSELVMRKDETEEAIKQRLNMFNKITMPVIDYYKEKGLVLEVNVERPINEVYEDIKKIFLELDRKV